MYKKYGVWLELKIRFSLALHYFNCRSVPYGKWFFFSFARISELSIFLFTHTARVWYQKILLASSEMSGPVVFYRYITRSFRVRNKDPWFKPEKILEYSDIRQLYQTCLVMQMQFFSHQTLYKRAFLARKGQTRKFLCDGAFYAFCFILTVFFYFI